MELKRKPNTLLRYERRIRGWSQQKIAETLGTSEDVISRWERGERSPSPYYQEKLCQLFGKPANELGLMESEHDIQGKERFLENQDLGFSPPLLATLDFGIVDRLERALTPRLKIDPATLGYLQFVVLGLKKQLVQGKQTNWAGLLVTSINQLGLYTNLLESHAERDEQLIVSLGENCLLVGDALFNMKDFVRAERYYQMALHAAKEAPNVALHAIAAGRYSLLLIDSRQYVQAQQLLEKALRLSEGKISSIICSWLWAVLAEAYANQGDEKRCYEALGAARTHLSLDVQRLDCYTFITELVPSVYGPTKLLGFEGACYLQLKQPEQAQSVLATSMKLSAHPHHQSLIYVDFAGSFIQQNSPEEATVSAKQALNFVQQTGSERAFQRILSIRLSLEPWNSLPAVRDLDDRISLFNTEKEHSNDG